MPKNETVSIENLQLCPRHSESRLSNKPNGAATPSRPGLILLACICTLLVAPDLKAAAWTFFVAGDTRSSPDVWERNVESMVALDPGAVALFNAGDITSKGCRDQWSAHMEAMVRGELLAQGQSTSSLPTDLNGIHRGTLLQSDASDFGPWIRYVGALGNHDDGADTCGENWLTNWNDFLPGQQSLGENSEDGGIYFSLVYDNAFFVVLDSVTTKSSSSARGPQTDWLVAETQTPAAQAATWRFAFLHVPIYPCNDKDVDDYLPQEVAMDWAQAFEDLEFDIVFVAHSHTYERTCPMKNGHCATGTEHGVVYLNSSAGAQRREIAPTRTGTQTNGTRTDSWDCQEILEEGYGDWYHFCHFLVDGSRLDMSCYSHDDTEFARDMLTIVKDGAPPPPPPPECVDLDGDNFPQAGSCDYSAYDCQDEDPAVYPGAPELCNRQDDDCDGQVDDGYDLDSDPENCGACGSSCLPGESCISGSCQSEKLPGERQNSTLMLLKGTTSCAAAAPAGGLGGLWTLILLFRLRPKSRRPKTGQ